jgi:hypothetical protein
MGLPNQQKLYALAQFIRSLAFFNWIDPNWAELHLFSALDADSAEARALLETLVLYGRYNELSMFARLKPRIFAAVLSEIVSNDARDRLTALVTWMTIRRLSGRNDVNITEAEARELLTRAPGKALRSIAWSLWRSLLDVKKARRKAHWARYINPFLEKVWPNDISTRDASISENLARIPSVAGAAFPDAVRVISSLVVPFKTYSVATGLGVDENSAILSRYADSLLELAIASIDLTSPPPYDLQKVLDEIANQDAELKSDVRYQKLNALLHGV